VSIPSTFNYPDQRSTFKTIVKSDRHAQMPVHVEHVRTSPGYNTSPLVQHMIGLHLGKPVEVAHWREQVAGLHRFRPGDVIFTRAGSPVNYAHPEPVEGLYFAIDPAYISEMSAQIGMTPGHVVLRDNFGRADPTIYGIGRAFLEELKTPGAGGKLYIEALVMQLSIHLLRHYSEGANETQNPSGVETDALRTRLRPAIDYIHDCFSDDISLADIAAIVHLTPYHFSRLFKRTVGVSPYQYVIRRRVEAAIHFLQHSNLTVMEIALSVGFSDHSHLIRHYKRLMGTSPRA
jgi:AraC family transcriptional regulator